MERKNTAPSPENPEEILPQLKKWLTAGRTTSTAFLFGTSVELVIQTARTHTLSAYPVDVSSLAYQRHLKSKNQHIYYTYPDLTNFNYHFPYHLALCPVTTPPLMHIVPLMPKL